MSVLRGRSGYDPTKTRSSSLASEAGAEHDWTSALNEVVSRPNLFSKEALGILAIGVPTLHLPSLASFKPDS